MVRKFELCGMSRFSMRARGASSSTNVLIYLLYFGCCGLSLGNQFNTTTRNITNVSASTSQVPSVLKTSFTSPRMPGKATTPKEDVVSTPNFSKQSSTMPPSKSPAGVDVTVMSMPKSSPQLIPGGLESTTSQQFTTKAFNQTDVKSIPYNHSETNTRNHIDWTQPESSTTKTITKDANHVHLEATSTVRQDSLGWTISTKAKRISEDTFGTTKESKRLSEPTSTSEAPEVNRSLHTAFIIVGALLLIPITMWALYFLWKRCRPPQQCPGTTEIIENGCQDRGPNNTKPELPTKASRNRDGAQQCLAMREEEDTHL